MSKTTHTPGPWRFNFSEDCDEVWPAKENLNDGKPICYCAGPDQATNVRLIAAAPELLAACEKQLALIAGLRNLLTFYRVGKRPTEKTLDAVSDAQAVMDEAVAAIAKAEGLPAATDIEARS